MAVMFNLRKERPALVIIAFIVTLVVYSVPHSLFGSQFDYASGKVTTGMIQLFPLLMGL
jgi:hypothetical protein